MRFESNVEMVRAGQFAAARLDLAKHTANHCAQGLLHDRVVGDQAVGRIIAHARLGETRRRAGQAL
jgi:hypothetical protein